MLEKIWLPKFVLICIAKNTKIKVKTHMKNLEKYLQYTLQIKEDILNRQRMFKD